MKIRLSLAQIHIETGDTEYNFSHGLDFIRQSAAGKSQVVLFPELWTSGYILEEREKISQANLEYISEITRLGKELNISIGGSFLVKENNHFYNRFILSVPDQPQPYLYDKTHLFRLMKEDEFLDAGNSLTIAEPFWGKTGLSICYDLRFPELFHYYGSENCLLTCLCAEWPIKRIDHWKTLIRARAIENQMFMASVNAVGNSNGESMGGSSAIISPWGEMISEANSEKETLLTSEIDLEQVTQVHQKMPVYRDRRPLVYAFPQGLTPKQSSPVKGSADQS